VKTLIKQSVIGLAMFMCLGAAHAAATADLAVIKTTIQKQFTTLGKGIVVKNVEPSPIDNLYLISLQDGQQVYVTADGKFFLVGDLMEIQKDKLVNVTEAAKSGERAIALAALKPKDSIVFPATGGKKATIYVFTDVDCGYCQKLHHEIAEYNKLGIDVHYLAFPRAGINSESYRKIASAWCADNRQAAFTKLTNREPIPENVCAGNPVAEQYKLGQKLGVNGTPAILTSEGRMIPGYVPPAELAKDLGI
jgi:thiol:disulfide interchange protein DsbC